MFPLISSPHAHQQTSVNRVMFSVILACIPGLIVATVVFGWGILFQTGVAVLAALICEAFVLWLRQKPIKLFLLDGSALVTAILLAISLPPLLPWWMTALGMAAAIIIAKHLYGGLGYNPFNPAMVGYIVLLISFPVAMTTLWAPPLELLPEQAKHLTFLETAKVIFTQTMPNIDGWSSATPLDSLKTALTTGLSVQQAQSELPILNQFAGEGWMWLNVTFLLAGLWLIFRRVIAWQIPVSMLGAIAVCAVIFNTYDSTVYPSVLFHLFSGGTMLGAFFIATDPVSAATSSKGRLIYGAGIGILIYLIRTWGGYPDAIAFAVLLMNMSAPAIDHISQPVTYGKNA